MPGTFFLFYADLGKWERLPAFAEGSSAFPDFHYTIEDLIAEEDRVAARLTYRGTHRGDLLGIAPTRKPVAYTGIAVFRLAGGMIVDGWVNGDTLGLMRQLGAVPALGPTASETA